MGDFFADEEGPIRVTAFLVSNATRKLRLSWAPGEEFRAFHVPWSQLAKGSNTPTVYRVSLLKPHAIEITEIFGNLRKSEEIENIGWPLKSMQITEIHRNRRNLWKSMKILGNRRYWLASEIYANRRNPWKSQTSLEIYGHHRFWGLFCIPGVAWCVFCPL